MLVKKRKKNTKKTHIDLKPIVSSLRSEIENIHIIKTLRKFETIVFFSNLLSKFIEIEDVCSNCIV